MNEQETERMERLASENSRMGQEIIALNRQIARTHGDDEVKFWETAFLTPPLGSCSMDDRIHSANQAVVARRVFLETRHELSIK